MPPQPVIIKSVDISASIKEVWQALTEPEKIKQWMNGAQVESTWRPGSDITFSGKNGKATYLNWIPTWT